MFAIGVYIYILAMSRYNARTMRFVRQLMTQEKTSEEMLQELRHTYLNDNTFIQMVSAIRFHCMQQLKLPPKEVLLECLTEKWQKEGQKGMMNEIETVLALTTFREMYHCAILRKCPSFVPRLCPEWLHRFQVPSRKQRQAKANETAPPVIHIPDLDLFVQWMVSKLDTSMDTEALFYSTVIFLATCTGRRMIEILGTGKFSIHNNFALVFQGQAKQRNKKRAQEQLLVVPTFFPACKLLPKIIQVQDYVRQHGGFVDGCTTSTQDDETRYQIHQKYVGKLNRALHQEFDNEIIAGTNYTFHDLRAIYAFLSYEFCCPREGPGGPHACPTMPFPRWMKQVLGHSELTTSLHYNRVHVATISPTVRDYFYNMVEPSDLSLTSSSSSSFVSDDVRVRLGEANDVVASSSS